MGKALRGLSVLLILLPLRAHAKFTSEGVNFWSAPDHTRVVIALEKPSPWVKKRLQGKQLEVIFKGRIKGRHKTTIKVNDSLIKHIRIFRDRNRVKAVLYLKRRTSFKVFSLRRFRDRPFRIVIDVLKPAEEIKRSMERRVEEGRMAKSHHKYVLVIDPGHGGSDPGAMGLFGLVEKDLVLDIARRTARYCNRSGNIRAFLTRTGDYYISLKKRVEIAHDYGADLFVSVHSNKAPSSKLSGVMAFTLSTRGVRTGLARMLEDIENAEEVVSDIKLSRRDKGLSHKVLKVAYDYSVTEGKRAASLITEYISYVSKMKNRGLRQASLKVLKNPGIPSLLLEIGFLSNYSDAQKLKSPYYRDRIAYGICEGVKAFFAYKDRLKKKKVYVVKKGDSLWKIARMHKVSLSELKKANNLKSPRLYPGMKLLIP